VVAKMQFEQCGLKTVHACDGLPIHPLQNWAVD
jgi:hypothetical protein